MRSIFQAVAAPKFRTFFLFLVNNALHWPRLLRNADFPVLLGCLSLAFRSLMPLFFHHLLRPTVRPNFTDESYDPGSTPHPASKLLSPNKYQFPSFRDIFGKHWSAQPEGLAFIASSLTSLSLVSPQVGQSLYFQIVFIVSPGSPVPFRRQKWSRTPIHHGHPPAPCRWSNWSSFCDSSYRYNWNFKGNPKPASIQA